MRFLFSLVVLTTLSAASFADSSYTSCSCGAVPGKAGLCRMTAVSAVDGAFHTEDKTSSTGQCDEQSCYQLFYQQYMSSCRAYIPGRPVASATGVEFTQCSCGATPSSPSSCRMLGISRATGAVAPETLAEKAQGESCDMSTCGRLFYQKFASRCEMFLPGPDRLPGGDE